MFTNIAFNKNLNMNVNTYTCKNQYEDRERDRYQYLYSHPVGHLNELKSILPNKTLIIFVGSFNMNGQIVTKSVHMINL